MKKILATIAIVAIALLPLQSFRASKTSGAIEKPDVIGINISNDTDDSYTLYIYGPTNMTVNIAPNADPSVGPLIPGTYSFVLYGCVGQHTLAVECGATVQTVSGNDCFLELDNQNLPITSFLTISLNPENPPLKK